MVIDAGRRIVAPFGVGLNYHLFRLEKAPQHAPLGAKRAGAGGRRFRQSRDGEAGCTAMACGNVGNGLS
jgi:hypothetical protein